MESRTIVKSLPREFLEILDGLRGHIRPESEGHLAVGGRDHGEFLGGVRFAHGNEQATPLASRRKLDFRHAAGDAEKDKHPRRIARSLRGR
jgi:hypothetical protein